MDAVIEPNEWLRIETGVYGDWQESSFANGTLQGVDGPGKDDIGSLEFTVQTHVGVPAEVRTQEQLAEYLEKTFQAFVDLDLCVSFHIQLGPAGDESDYETYDDEGE